MGINESSPSVKLVSLAFVLVSAILSVGNWHIAAQYGIHSIFYLIFASLFFMVPVAFVSCELASSYSSFGGIFHWIKDAFGIKPAILSAWLMWVSNVVWYPTVFTFMTRCLLYYFEFSSVDSRLLTFVIMNVLFWSGNFINIYGYKFSSKVLSLSVLFSMVIPACLLIGFGVLKYYIGLDSPAFSHHDLSDFIPKDQKGFILLTGLLLGFTGMEMAMSHYHAVDEPKKYFPKAIWLSTFFLIFISILGTLGISQAIPKENINLISDSLDAIYYYLKLFKLEKLMPWINTLISFGTWLGMSAYLAEPSKAFFQAVKFSGLSRGLAKSNEYSIPTTIMIIQGIFVTLISIPFALFPDSSDFYWLLTDIASQLYLVIYVMMFFAVIKVKVIKKTFPINIIPFKEKGIVFLGTVGASLSLVCFVFGCLPPERTSHTYPLLYSSFVIIFISAMALVPLMVLKYKRLRKSLADEKSYEI